MKNKNKYISVLISLAVASTLLISSPASAATKCSSANKASYKKAYAQYILRNKIIDLSNQIKQVIEDARQRKSNLLGRYVDYTAKDIYDLNKQDASISKAETERDNWEAILQPLADKCNLPMPSPGDLS